MPADMRRNVLLASATSYMQILDFRFRPARGQHQRLVSDRRSAICDQPLSEILAEDSTSQQPGLAPDTMPQDSSVTAWSNLDSPLWTISRPASSLNFSGPDGMGLVTPLKGNLWLNAALYKPLTSDLWRAQSLLSIAITGLVLCAIGVFFANRIARPLRELTKSAEAIGRGEAIANIPEAGPDDIRRLCEAFNRMQSRLRRFVDDRTKMLAAIGHDLRTPLTTLRLRAEFIADEELQQKILATIDEMQTMTEATLSFAKERSGGRGHANRRPQCAGREPLRRSGRDRSRRGVCRRRSPRLSLPAGRHKTRRPQPDRECIALWRPRVRAAGVQPIHGGHTGRRRGSGYSAGGNRAGLCALLSPRAVTQPRDRRGRPWAFDRPGDHSPSRRRHRAVAKQSGPSRRRDLAASLTGGRGAGAARRSACTTLNGRTLANFCDRLHPCRIPNPHEERSEREPNRQIR